MEARYRASILVAVELNRYPTISFISGWASLNTACALVVGSLPVPGLILEPYKRWPITVVLFTRAI